MNPLFAAVLLPLAAGLAFADSADNIGPKFDFHGARRIDQAPRPAPAAAAPAWLKLPFDASQAAVMEAGTKDCAPAAIFNALNAGTPDLKKTILHLEGANLREKYRTFLKNVSQKPSEQFQGRVPRTRSQSGGTWTGDIRFMFADALDIAGENTPRYRGGYTPRFDGESPGRATERIHREIAGSVAAGVAPVLEFGEFAKGSRGGGHYVTIIGVTGAVENGSFGIMYFDPELGKTQTLWTHEEMKTSFGAKTWEIYDQSGRPVNAGLRAGSGVVNSPFLKLRTLAKIEADDSGDFYTLEMLFGDIKYENLDPAPAP
jgi:hypothetical protein